MPRVPPPKAWAAEVERFLFALAAEAERRRLLANSHPEVVREATLALWRDDLIARVAESIEFGLFIFEFDPRWAVDIGVGYGFSPQPKELRDEPPR